MRQNLRQSKKLAREIAQWHAKLAPQLPDIDAEDLHLILWSLLRRKHGGHYNFLLKRRKDGAYVR
jgi:hypothetical protein